MQHRPGIHRRELVGIAQQDHPGAGGNRLKQLMGQLQVQHGSFINHHQIKRQAKLRSVLGAAFFIHAQQSVNGLRLVDVCAADRRTRQRRRHGLFHALRSLASGRRQGNAQIRLLLHQCLDDPRQGVGLAGARSPGDQGQGMAGGLLQGMLLQGVQCGLSGDFDGRHAGLQDAAQVAGQLVLLGPVPPQVQRLLVVDHRLGLLQTGSPDRRCRRAGQRQTGVALIDVQAELADLLVQLWVVIHRPALQGQPALRQDVPPVQGKIC